MRMSRAEFGWLALVGVVLLLGVWWIPGGGALSTDSYSVAHSGKKAFFRVLRELNADVRRGTNQLIPDQDFGDGTLAILGPARYPTSQEWDAILLHVSSGANLVFAAKSDDPAVRIDLLNMRVVMPEADRKSIGRGAKKFDSKENDEADEPAEKKDAETISFFKSDKLVAKTDLVSGDVHWSGVGYLQTTNPTWKTLVEAGGQPRVMSRPYGSGHVIVSSSDRLFSNQELLDGTNALLAYRIVTASGGPKPIVVDETLNRSGVPKVFGILFDPELRPLTLQLMLALVLFGWCGSRRFGPMSPPADPPRRSIVEHAVALGGLYYRTRSAGMVLARWLQHFRHEFHLTSQDQAARKESEMLARWAGVDSAEVKDLMDSVHRAIHDPKTSNAFAAKRIRALAELRLRITSRLRRTKNAA